MADVERTGPITFHEQTANLNEFSFNAEIPEDCDFVLLIYGIRTGGGTTTLTELSVGEESATPIQHAEDGTGVVQIQAFRLVNPPTGEEVAIEATQSAVRNGNQTASITVIPYRNVNPTTPVGTPATPTTGDSTSPSIAVPSDEGDYAVMALVIRNVPTVAPGSPATTVWHEATSLGSVAGNDHRQYGATREGQEASTTISATLNSAREWIALGFVLNAAEESADQIEGTSPGGSEDTATASLRHAIEGVSEGGSEDSAEASVGVKEFIEGDSPGASEDSAGATARLSIEGESPGSSEDEATAFVAVKEFIEGNSPGASEDSAGAMARLSIEGVSPGASDDSVTPSTRVSIEGESPGTSLDTASSDGRNLISGVSEGSSEDTGSVELKVNLEGVSPGGSEDSAEASIVVFIEGTSPGGSLDEGNIDAPSIELLEGDSLGGSLDEGDLDLHIVGTLVSPGGSLDFANISLKVNIVGWSHGFSADGGELLEVGLGPGPPEPPGPGEWVDCADGEDMEEVSCPPGTATVWETKSSTEISWEDKDAMS